MQGKVAVYLNKLAQLGVAGVRVDAAKHMNTWDMGSILQVCCIPKHRSLCRTFSTPAPQTLKQELLLHY